MSTPNFTISPDDNLRAELDEFRDRYMKPMNEKIDRDERAFYATLASDLGLT